MADENDTTNEHEEQDENEERDENDEREDPLEGLSPEARRAVERANSQAATRRRELQAARTQLEARERELTELRQQHESDQEKAVREAEERGELAATERFAPRLLEADLAIAAAGRLRDPGDAMGLLSRETLDALLAVDDGAERRKLAEEAIGKLLEEKPYLAVDESNGPAKGLVSQGARSKSPATRVPQTPDDWLRGRSKS